MKGTAIIPLSNFFERERLIRPMVWVVLAGVFFLSPMGLAQAQLPDAPVYDPIAGSRVFGAKVCAGCHVEQRLGPDLEGVQEPRSFYDFAAALWNHVPRMWGPPRDFDRWPLHLSAQDAGDLMAFLFTLGYFDRPGDPAAGRRVFSEKKCIACHQIGGAGGVIGPNLDALREYGSPVFLAAAMWNHGPVMTEVMRRQGIERAVFTERELRDLISYIGSASPGQEWTPLNVGPGHVNQGRRLFTEKYCIQCHVVLGKGERIGPDLDKRTVSAGSMEFAAAMWNKAPAMTRAMEKKGIPAVRLRPEEVSDIVAYLDAAHRIDDLARRGGGRELLTRKGCLECHSLDGRGGKVAGELSQARGIDSLAAFAAQLWNHAAVSAPGKQRKSMWPRFNAEEMSDLFAFLQTPGWER